MSKKVLKGKDLMLFVGGEATSLATSHTLGLNAETGDAASKDSGAWDESTITKMSWEAGTESLMSVEEGANSFDVMFQKFIAGEPVELVLGIPTNINTSGVPAEGWTAPTTTHYKGSALITALSVNATNGQNTTMSASFKGVGKLERVSVSV